MALTATATPRVSADIVAQLSMRSAAVFTSSFNRPNLHYEVLKKDKQVVKAMAQRIAQQHAVRTLGVESGIIYCLSRADCEKVAAELEVRSRTFRLALQRRLHMCQHDYERSVASICQTFAQALPASRAPLQADPAWQPCVVCCSDDTKARQL